MKVNTLYDADECAKELLHPSLYAKQPCFRHSTHTYTAYTHSHNHATSL